MIMCAHFSGFWFRDTENDWNRVDEWRIAEFHIIAPEVGGYGKFQTITPGFQFADLGNFGTATVSVGYLSLIPLSEPTRQAEKS